MTRPTWRVLLDARPIVSQPALSRLAPSQLSGFDQFTRPLVRGRYDDAAEITAALGSLSLPAECNVDVDCSYDEVSGTYNNSRLDAFNVWTTNLEPCLVAEAAAMFESCGLRAAFRRLSTADENSCGEEVKCIDGERFFANSAGWKSDVGWLSADDQPTHDTFLALFQRMGVAKTFEPIVGGTVHLYSAFFVVRSACSAPDLHVDYGKKVKTTALTLMTPLYEEYSAVEDFQLLYCNHAGSLRRYRYQLGEAIVFGARFFHSTEPGAAALEPTDPGYTRNPASQHPADPTTAPCQQEESARKRMGGSNDEMPPARRAHAYLCFAFGSNKAEDWGPIAETVDGQQTRQISRPGQPNGANNLSLSKLGLRIESGAAPAAPKYGRMGHGMGDDSQKVGGRPSMLRRRSPKGILK